MPRTPAQAIGFLVGLWIAFALSPLIVTTAAGQTPAAEAAIADALHREVNRVRALHHRVELARRAELDHVAVSHCVDMAQRDYFSHVSPEGSSPLDRIETAGLQTMTLAAENLGSTDETDPIRRIVENWLTSPEHRRNLLAPAMNTTGIGVVRGRRGQLLFTQLYVSIPRH